MVTMRKTLPCRLSAVQEYAQGVRTIFLCDVNMQLAFDLIVHMEWSKKAAYMLYGPKQKM